MGFSAFFAVYRPPGAPYGFSKSEKNICRVELLGGQHIKKSATQVVAKRVIFGKNMFFELFSMSLKNIVFQSISQSIKRQMRLDLYR